MSRHMRLWSPLVRPVDSSFVVPRFGFSWPGCEMIFVSRDSRLGVFSSFELMGSDRV